MAKKTIDHKGNEFKSVSEMCRYWGVSSKLFYSRYKHCRDLEYCLSPKKVKGGRLAGVPVEDHLGNTFKTKKAMALQTRLSSGLWVNLMYVTL